MDNKACCLWSHGSQHRSSSLRNSLGSHHLKIEIKVQHILIGYSQSNTVVTRSYLYVHHVLVDTISISFVQSSCSPSLRSQVYVFSGCDLDRDMPMSCSLCGGVGCPGRYSVDHRKKSADSSQIGRQDWKLSVEEPRWKAATTKRGTRWICTIYMISPLWTILKSK